MSAEARGNVARLRRGGIDDWPLRGGLFRPGFVTCGRRRRRRPVGPSRLGWSDCRRASLEAQGALGARPERARLACATHAPRAERRPARGEARPVTSRRRPARSPPREQVTAHDPGSTAETTLGTSGRWGRGRVALAHSRPPPDARGVARAVRRRRRELARAQEPARSGCRDDARAGARVSGAGSDVTRSFEGPTTAGAARSGSAFGARPARGASTTTVGAAIAGPRHAVGVRGESAGARSGAGRALFGPTASRRGEEESVAPEARARDAGAGGGAASSEGDAFSVVAADEVPSRRAATRSEPSGTKGTRAGAAGLARPAPRTAGELTTRAAGGPAAASAGAAGEAPDGATTVSRQERASATGSRSTCAAATSVGPCSWPGSGVGAGAGAATEPRASGTDG